MDDESNACCYGENGTAEDIAQRFLPGETRLRLRPLGAGLINETHLVETGGQRFVLQRINNAVFPDADAIAENLSWVQDWLCAQTDHSVRLPRMIRAPGGEATLRDADGRAWRLLEHIEHSRVIKPLENLIQAAEIGRALGRFHVALAELDPSRLAFTLAGLHDTPRYKANLDSAIQAAQAPEQTASPLRVNAASRRPVDAEVLAALKKIEARIALIPRLSQARAEGILSLHVTHGDPKLDNVLFARGEDRALCLIDLDTVQPGLLHEDIADCLRSCCNRGVGIGPGNGTSQPSSSPSEPGNSTYKLGNGAAELGTDTSEPGHGMPELCSSPCEPDSSVPESSSSSAKPSGSTAEPGDRTASARSSEGRGNGRIGQAQAVFDLDVCRALLSGYAEHAAALFNDDAIALLYPAIRLIPLELAIRFLTDYLEGDHYFRVSSPRQNLDKTLIQLALVKDIETKRAAIEEIIHDSFSPRRSHA